jgi:hypothetical protein
MMGHHIQTVPRAGCYSGKALLREELAGMDRVRAFAPADLSTRVAIGQSKQAPGSDLRGDDMHGLIRPCQIHDLPDRIRAAPGSTA